MALASRPNRTVPISNSSKLPRRAGRWASVFAPPACATVQGKCEHPSGGSLLQPAGRSSQQIGEKMCGKEWCINEDQSAA